MLRALTNRPLLDSLVVETGFREAFLGRVLEGARKFLWMSVHFRARKRHGQQRKFMTKDMWKQFSPQNREVPGRSHRTSLQHSQRICRTRIGRAIQVWVWARLCRQGRDCWHPTAMNILFLTPCLKLRFPMIDAGA